MASQPQWGVPRHVAITGASSGIGAALARLYARPGVMLSLTGRNQDRLECVANECRAAGAEVAIAALDVTDAPGMNRWLLERDAAHAFDLVIANAGIGGAGAMAPESGESGPVARQIFEINLIGVVNTVTAVLPAMVARRRGHIAIMSSLAGYIALPDAPAYSASKSAVRLYGHALRRRVAPRGVWVSVISPGFIETPLIANLPATPFLWPAERAARHIVAGLERRKREIVFPLALRIAVRIADLLPTALIDAVLIRGSERIRDRSRDVGT
jgi:short-subunit dehydrogenase